MKSEIGQSINLMAVGDIMLGDSSLCIGFGVGSKIRASGVTFPFLQVADVLRKGDIVFARTGATTGKSFLINECPEAVFASYLIRLRVKQSVSPEYLRQYFQSPSYWVQIIDAKKGTGQPNVNGKKLANITVPIPSPDEQREIVQYLTNLDRKVQELKLQLIQSGKELDSLLPSLLNSAFKGEL